MRRRSATTGLIIEASCVLQETVVVLYKPECDAAMQDLGTALRRVDSCRTRVAILRSELVIVLCGLVGDNNSEVTSAGQGCLQTRL